MFILVLVILQRKTGSGGGHQRRLSAVSQRIQPTDHYLGAFETHSSRSVIEVNQSLYYILIRIGVICKKHGHISVVFEILFTFCAKVLPKCNKMTTRC